MVNSGSSSVCSGTFSDQGGAGNYSDNLNQTFTLCSSVPGSHVQIDFSSFDLELNRDFLKIYNGSTIAAPLIGTFTGAIGPGYVQGNNASGCLTFVFTSDGSGNAQGWLASIDCGLPCQTVIADITTGPVDADGIVNVCQGSNVTYNGTGIFPQNNLNYAQSNATSTFEWTFGDGTTATGQTVSNNFTTPGIYNVDLVVTDVNGCVSTNDINIYVQVPSQPDFTGTSAASSTICLGDTNVLTGMVEPIEIDLIIPPVVGQNTIPDANGVLNIGNAISAFNIGQTVTNANNLQSVCIDLEHSNLGNLEIKLFCPNGQSVILKSFASGGNGIYLGNPIANALGLGSGFEYCFSMTCATSLVGGPTVLSGTPLSNSIATGAYLPSGNFSSLVGCPLNGNWTIQVNDNTATNDGNTFQWAISFDPVIYPGGSQFIPNITTSGWASDPTIVSSVGDEIVVAPTSPGTVCYDFEATDEFDCPYTEQVCFTVLAPGQGGCPQCTITNFTAVSTIAQCSDQYTTTGIIEFTEAPRSGDLIVRDCQGNQIIVDSYPFVSPVNYSLSGTNADGLACNVQAYFSNDTTCKQIISFLLLTAYPGDQAGTVTTSMTGSSTHPYILCNTDSFQSSSNNNYSIPLIAPNVDPGLGYYVYRCPPTISGVGVDPTTDPCYVTSLTTKDITLINNGGSTDGFLSSLGLLTNNTFYIVPMTFLSVSNEVINSTCYDLELAQTMTVQYLNPISTIITQDCYLGSASITLNGGYPQFYGGNYTASNLLPLTANFVNTSTNLGGSIVIEGLQDRQNWSFTVTDGNGCPQSVSGTFSGPQDASFTYSQTGYCLTASNQFPIVTGISGGTFSSTGGISIDASTGEIDIANSTPGNYDIIYKTPAATCFGKDTFNITITSLPVVSAGPNQTVCEGTSIILYGSGANTYTWDNGIIDSVTFIPSNGSTTYTLTGTNLFGCSVSDNVVVNVIDAPIVEAGIDQAFCIGNSTTVNASNVTGLTFSWNNAVTDAVSFTPAVGSIYYVLTGVDPATSCSGKDSILITVSPLPIVNAGPDKGVCVNNTLTLSATGASTYVWNGGITDGVPFIPTLDTTYTVIGTSAQGCVNIDSVHVTMFTQSVLAAGPDTTICSGNLAVLNAYNGNIYNWNNGLGIGNPLNVTPSFTTTYVVSGLDTNACFGTDTMIVFVNDLPIVNAGPNQAICIGSSTMLTATGAISYVWNNGISNGVSFTPSLGFNNYTVIGTDINGCFATDNVSILVNPLPLINAGTDQTVCFGTLVSLIASGAPNLTWDNGVVNNISFSPSSTATYTVTGIDLNGCQNSDQLIVNVNQLPNVNAGTDQTVCLGTQITLSGNGAITYSWNNGASNGIQFTPVLGTVTYTLTGTDANGCQNTDQTIITVNPNPSPVLTGATEYCFGFTSLITTTQVYSAYSWSNGSINSSINATITDNPISVTVTNTFGCSVLTAGLILIENPIIVNNYSVEICQGQTALIHGVHQSIAGIYSQTLPAITGCDSTANVTLIVHALPTIDGGNDIIVCTPNLITLSANGALSYVWDHGEVNGVPFNQSVGQVTYTVVGTDLNGCQNSDQVDVTVNPLPNLNAGNNLALCFGDSVTLTAIGAINYIWDFGVQNGVPFSPMVSNTFTVLGTDINGCSTSGQVTVSVNPLPIVDGGIATPVCQGVQVTLNANGALTYSWDQGVLNGVPFTAPIGTTSYAVIGTDINGCQNTDQASVTVYPLPVVQAGPDQSFCSGENVTLSGSGAATYSWNNGIQNGISFTPNAGVNSFTVTGISVNNCVNTDQVIITVFPNPIVNAGSDLEICVGDFVLLSGTGAQTYSWDNNVINGFTFSPSVGTVTYTIVGTDINGCVGSDEVDIIVNPLPNVNAGLDTLICPGSSVTLTASGASTYSWNGNVVNGAPFIPVQSATYTVTGTSSEGCVATDQVSVQLELIPNITFSPNITFGCSPVTVTFTNHTQNISGCSWGFGDGTTYNGCGPVTHTFSSDFGNNCFDVNLTVTTSNNCITSKTENNLICVEALPIAEFTSSQFTMPNSNTTCDFTNFSSGASNYTWTFGDGANSIETSPSHTYPNNEYVDYLITLIAFSPSGCSDTANLKVNVVEQLLYYIPNTFTPDGDEVNQTFLPIFSSGIDIYEFTLLIFDRWGELIFESHDPSKGWNGKYGNEGNLVQDDTYVWKILYKEKNSQQRHVEVGHVNVLK